MEQLLHNQSDLLHDISTNITDEQYKALMENLGKIQAVVTAPRVIEYRGFRPVNIFPVDDDEGTAVEETLPFRHTVHIKDDAHRAKLVHFKERFERRDYENEVDEMEVDDDYDDDEDDDYDDDYDSNEEDYDADDGANDMSFSYYNNMIKICVEELDVSLFGDLEELFKQQTILISRVAQAMSEDECGAGYIAQGGVAYITAINFI